MRSLSICPCIIALAYDNGTWIALGTEVDDPFEGVVVARFAPGETEGNWIYETG
jgi:hypothetical protein